MDSDFLNIFKSRFVIYKTKVKQMKLESFILVSQSINGTKNLNL